MSQDHAECARCPFEPSQRSCQNPGGRAPSLCPTMNQADVIEKAAGELKKTDLLEFSRQASIQEADGYGDKELGYEQTKPVKPRILEIIEFAEKMRYRKLGLVFCIGLRKEARVVESLLADRGFTVVSVICKMGCVPKEALGLRDDQKIRKGSFEAMCNPMGQAFAVNDAGTQFNIVMGLCVGHDSLFFKHAEAPCTVFAVKDRLLGHNPLAAIYTIDSYYRSLKVPAAKA